MFLGKKSKEFQNLIPRNAFSVSTPSRRKQSKDEVVYFMFVHE